MGKNTVQAKQCLDMCYADSAPSRQMLETLFADFKRGRTNTDDAERSDRSNLAVVLENIKEVHKMDDRKLKFRDLAGTLKISKDSVFTILHGYLSMRKLCSK